MSETESMRPQGRKSGVAKSIGVGCGGLLLLFIILAVVFGPDADPKTTAGIADSLSAGPSVPKRSSSSESETDLPPHSRLLRQADFGGRWPLSVAQGIVECRDGSAILFHAGGKVYPVNGVAKSWYGDLPKIEEIWLDDSTMPGLKIGIGPILDAGLKLCQ